MGGRRHRHFPEHGAEPRITVQGTVVVNKIDFESGSWHLVNGTISLNQTNTPFDDLTQENVANYTVVNDTISSTIIGNAAGDGLVKTGPGTVALASYSNNVPSITLPTGSGLKYQISGWGCCPWLGKMIFSWHGTPTTHRLSECRLPCHEPWQWAWNHLLERR